MERQTYDGMQDVGKRTNTGRLHYLAYDPYFGDVTSGAIAIRKTI